MNEIKELGNWVRNIRLTWLAGTRYNRKIILRGQIASTSQEITEGGTNLNSKNWKKGDCAYVSIGAKRKSVNACAKQHSLKTYEFGKGNCLSYGLQKFL